MKFCELAHVFHKYKRDRSEDAAMCVKILTDAILDDVSLQVIGNSGKEKNPLYGLSKSTLQAIFNGKRLMIPQNAAAAMLSRADEEQFADFVNDYSYDARVQMAEDVSEYGFDARPDNVAEICANIMFQIINLRAENKYDDVTTLTYRRKETGKRIKNIAPATIERRGDKLHICGEEIIIRKEIFPDDMKKGLKCFQALCDVYAEALKITDRVITEKDLPSLPDWCQEDFADQQECYFSAEGIQHSIRDVFDDGEDEFKLLKKDAWQGINMTFRKRYDTGYDRLIAVLEKITNTRLDLSALVQIRNLIGNMERKGICHILVNDGTIDSWVRKDA